MRTLLPRSSFKLPLVLFDGTSHLRCFFFLRLLSFFLPQHQLPQNKALKGLTQQKRQFLNFLGCPGAASSSPSGRLGSSPLSDLLNLHHRGLAPPGVRFGLLSSWLDQKPSAGPSEPSSSPGSTVRSLHFKTLPGARAPFKLLVLSLPIAARFPAQSKNIPPSPPTAQPTPLGAAECWRPVCRQKRSYDKDSAA